MRRIIVIVSAVIMLAAAWLALDSAVVAQDPKPKVIKLRASANDPFRGARAVTFDVFGSSRDPVNPELAELHEKDHEFDAKIRTELAKYAGTEDEAARQATAEAVQKLVEEHFAVRQSIRQHELQELEAQLNRLRTLHEQRTAQKDRIVEDRVQQLLRDSTGLGWGATASPGGVGFEWAKGPLVRGPLPPHPPARVLIDAQQAVIDAAEAISLPPSPPATAK